MNNQEKQTLIFDDVNLKHGFAQIPNVVLRDPKLSAQAVRLYGLLLSYAWQNNQCFPGQCLLADNMGIDKRTVGRILTELKTHKLISWKRLGQGKPNVYRIRKLNAGYYPKQMVDKGG